MIKCFKRIFNKKGVSLVEMIVAMLVMVTIMISVTTVFAPMLVTYQRASNLAEVNTLLDNISAFIMDDVSRAVEIAVPAPPLQVVPDPDDLTQNFDLTPLFRIRTTFWNDYYLGPDGTLWLNVQGLDAPVRMLPRDFYKFRGADTVFRVVQPTALAVNAANGMVTLTLTIESIDGWQRDRTYTARPIGLN